MKKIIDTILLYYYVFAILFVSITLILLAIFGGEVHIKINWHSAVELYKTINGN